MNNWPIYYKDVLDVSNPKSNIGICTLWTPKNKVLDGLNKESFSVGGQLYSKRGVNYILRNVLANPVIDHIVLCGADRSASGESLLKLVNNGVSDDHRVIGDEKLEIDKGISRNAINDFRKNVRIIDQRNNLDVKKVVDKLYSKKETSKLWAKERVFKETKFKPAQKFPSERSTFTCRANHIWEAWIQMLRLIMKFGSDKGMIKIGKVKELVNLISVIENEDPYSPEISKDFNFSEKDIKLYFKDFFSSDKGSESYNYGERIYAYPVGLPLGEFNALNNEKLLKDLRIKNKELKIKNEKLRIEGGVDQLEEVYEKYKRYHEDRGMVIAIWNPWIDNVKKGWMSNELQNSKNETRNSKQKRNPKPETISQKSAGNVPCMVLLQFTYRSKKLHMTAYFRSNDIFDAWPRNAFALRKLQFDFAKRIKKKPGYLTTISNCAQIYEANFEEANKLIEKYKDHTFCRPDPRSTVIIEIVNEEIVARHMTPDGNVQLDEYSIKGTLPKASLKLLDKLIVNNVLSTEYHIADISSELTKAEWCVKNKKKFTQDKDWEELK